MSISEYELIEQGEYSQAATILEKITRPTIEQQVLGQLVALETKNPDTAYRNARGLLNRRLGDFEHVLCLFAIARGSVLTEQYENAVAAGRQAVELSIKKGDPALVARAQARQTGTVLRCVGIEATLPELRKLRSYAFAAGDPAALIEFHCLVAEIEIKQRRNANASAHLRTAQSLCDRFPHLRLQTQIYRLTANAALFSSRPFEAKDWARAAVDSAERSGGCLSLVACLSTLAHACLMLRALDDAEGALKRILTISGPEGGRLAAIDGLIQVALERNDLIEASRLVEMVKTPPAESAALYYWLWHVPIRARWLITQNDPKAALALLQRFAGSATATRDEELLHTFRLVEAEVRAACGETNLAAEQLGRALSSPYLMTLRGALVLNRIASQLFGDKNPIGRNLGRRANRVQDLGLARLSSTPPQDELYSSAFEFLHAAASFFATPTEPRLIAHDLVPLLQTIGFTDARVEQQDIGRDKVSSSSPADPNYLVRKVSIDCGTTGTLRYRVVADAPRDAERHLALLAVTSLVKYATALARAEEQHSAETPLWPQDTPDSHIGMIVAAASMTELLSVTRRVATSNITVLFTGETGTGKELLARALHDASPRRARPFVPFNCTAVARDMLDSQLFGYRRGAFTGALEAFPGVIRAAAGGTLFLDEIGELPLDVQPKLLRFLESGEIHPLGESLPTTVDVRVVAATNADLERLVADGRFREDLYYRLNVVRLQVPPLRERREEIPLIAQHYIDQCSRDTQKTGIRLAEDTMEYLVLYRWPGNVRQLANEMRRMVALAETGAVLMPEHLSREIAASRRTIPASQREIAPTEFVVRMDQPMSAAIEHLERGMIQYAMQMAEGRQEHAARLLGLSRKGLYLKRARLKMPLPMLRDDGDAGAGADRAGDSPRAS